LAVTRTLVAMDLDGIADWAVGLMEKLGGPGAGLAIALENLFPPLPSEVILPLAGFTASQGNMSFISALVWTTLGSLVGATALYFIGAALGRDRMRWIVAKMPLVDVADFERAEAFFARHGGKTIFFGRMIPIFRSLISIPAGIERMPLPKFGLLTLAGSAIWNTIFVTAGYLLGENWHIVERYADIFQKIVIVVVAALVIWWVVRRVLSIRHGRREQRNSLDPEPRRAAGEPDDSGSPRTDSPSTGSRTDSPRADAPRADSDDSNSTSSAG
jgi:membrane protein DedA with SNARE-associated domain